MPLAIFFWQKKNFLTSIVLSSSSILLTPLPVHPVRICCSEKIKQFNLSYFLRRKQHTSFLLTCPFMNAIIEAGSEKRIFKNKSMVVLKRKNLIQNFTHLLLLCILNETEDLKTLSQELQGYSSPSMCFSACSLI